MKNYLLDTNICIHLMRRNKGVIEQIEDKGWENCCISEITVAELLYGAEKSNDVEKNLRIVKEFCEDIEIVPLCTALRKYAYNKALLRRAGIPVDDLDLFIGSTAIANHQIMVTENVKHLNRLPDIVIENWVKR